MVSPKAATSRRLIDKRQLLERVPLSYPTIWKRMKAGTFPRPYVENGAKNAWTDNGGFVSKGWRALYYGEKVEKSHDIP